MDARSLTTAVRRPIMRREQRNVSHPPPTEVGGMNANNTWWERERERREKGAGGGGGGERERENEKERKRERVRKRERE